MSAMWPAATSPVSHASRPDPVVTVRLSPEEGRGWHSDGRSFTAGRHRRQVRSSAPDERLSWGRTVGHRCAARHRDVRRDVRLPARHGAGPEPRDHDVRRRDDPVPAHHAGPGAELPRHQRVLRRCASSRSGPRRTATRIGHRRDPGRRARARCRRRADQLPRRPGHPPGVPAGGHRRRGHADRLRPRLRGRRRLLAAGPLGRADHDVRAVPDDGAAARASGAASRSCSPWSSATPCPGSWTRRRATSRRCTVEPPRRRRIHG